MHKTPKQPNAHSALILARILTLSLGVGVTALILLNSSRTGADSSNLSSNITSWLNNQSIITSTGISFSETLVRKLGHIGEFSLLGLVLLFILRTFTPHPLRQLGWVLFSGLAVAVSDELLQLFITGRSSEVLNVVIDFAGIIIGLCLGLLIVRLARPLFYRLDNK